MFASFLLFLVFFVGTYCSELHVNVKVGGFDYTLNFEPAITAPSTMARTFCMEQGNRFGITMETLDNCITPITNHLVAAVAKEAAAQKEDKKPISNVPATTNELTPLLAKFKIEGRDYQISFYPTLATPERVATEFCSKKGAEFGITDATFSTCVNPVSSHITGLVAEHNKAQLAALVTAQPPKQEPRTITVDLTIDKQEFHLRFQPEVTSTRKVATQLCVEKGTTFGVTQATLDQCISTIAAYLDQEVKKQ